MKLGELKIASLMLIAPSLEIFFDSSDGQGLENKIMELKSNPNLTDYLGQMDFSINRALSIIEKYKMSKSKRKIIAYEALNQGPSGYELRLDKIGDDVLYIESIYQGAMCQFELKGEDVVILPHVKKETLEIIYKERLKRINESTSDLHEIRLDDGVLSIIPYFVKSELILSEDEAESNLARTHFFNLLEELSKPSAHYGEMCVDTVYQIW